MWHWLERRIVREAWGKGAQGREGCLMCAGQWSGWAAAVVSAASAVGSLVGWWRSRAAKAEATEQARLATAAQVSRAAALKQIADARVAQQETQAQRLTAEEVAPWAVEPIPGRTTGRYLRNKAGTRSTASLLPDLRNGMASPT